MNINHCIVSLHLSLTKKQKKMKKTILLSIALMILFLAACKPTKEDALKYNNDIIKEQKAVMAELNSLDKAIYTYDGNKMDLAYNNLDIQLKKSMDVINKMDDLGGKSDFKNATLAYFKAIQEGMVAEMKPIMNHYRKPVTETTAEDDKKAEALFDKNIERVSKADDAFYKAQLAQSKEYGYLIESK